MSTAFSRADVPCRRDRTSYAEALARVTPRARRGRRPGDVTTLATVPADGPPPASCGQGAGRAAGLDAFAAVFAALDPAVRVEPLAAEGDRSAAATPVARVAGPARALLTGERWRST